MHHIFNVVEYFLSLSGNRRDDPLTATWKYLQRRAWASLLLLAGALVVLSATGSMLETMEGNEILRSLADGSRPSAAWVVGGGTILICVFSMYSWGAVVWFAHKHGAE